MAAKIGFLDIETAPNLGWTWGKYDQNVIAFEQTTYMLCWSWKWIGDSGVISGSLCDYPNYQKDRTNDRLLVKDLWGLFDQADIIVAHNGDAFDIKRTNARFITHDLPPPSPYKTIDTLKIAKKHFKFESNSLKDLAEHLGLGTKLQTGGFSLWKKCMAGDPEAWERMVDYNVQDTLLLEAVYNKLKPWATTHPNLQMYETFPQAAGCTHCGSTKVQRRGFSYAKTQVRQRFQCQECHSWFSGGVVKKND